MSLIVPISAMAYRGQRSFSDAGDAFRLTWFTAISMLAVTVAVFLHVASKLHTLQQACVGGVLVISLMSLLSPNGSDAFFFMDVDSSILGAVASLLVVLGIESRARAFSAVALVISLVSPLFGWAAGADFACGVSMNFIQSVYVGIASACLLFFER